jgi:hypothetical protein
MKDLPDSTTIWKQLSGNISALTLSLLADDALRNPPLRFWPTTLSGILRYTSQHKYFAPLRLPELVGPGSIRPMQLATEQKGNYGELVEGISAGDGWHRIVWKEVR